MEKRCNSPPERSLISRSCVKKKTKDVAGKYLPKPTIDDEFLTNIHRIHRCLDINQVAKDLRICVGDSFNRQKGSPTGSKRSPVVANISWTSNTYASLRISSRVKCCVSHVFFVAFFGIFSCFLLTNITKGTCQC